MGKECLVSVIIPVYHVEKYLDDCVRSIVTQSYSNLEIILVDEGSDDSCPQMCDFWAEKDERIKVIHKENGGLSDARNAGLDVAQGQYIAFVDSDDFVHPDYIKKLAIILKQKDCDIAICGFEKFVDGSDIPTTETNGIVKYVNPKDCYVHTDAYFDVAWNKLYRRTTIGDVRYPYRKLHEDIYTTYKIMFAAKKIGLTQDVLYFYRQRIDSIIGKQDNRPGTDMEQALWDRVEFFKTIDQVVYAESLTAYIDNVTCIVKGISKGRIKGNNEQIHVMKQRLKQLIPKLLECEGLPMKNKIKLCVKAVI